MKEKYAVTNINMANQKTLIFVNGQNVQVKFDASGNAETDMATAAELLKVKGYTAMVGSDNTHQASPTPDSADKQPEAPSPEPGPAPEAPVTPPEVPESPQPPPDAPEDIETMDPSGSAEIKDKKKSQ